MKQKKKVAKVAVTRDPVRTRAAILAAARTLLAAEGKDALNVSRVAELAGVNRGTAYLHFRSREELTLATLADVSAQLSGVVVAASQDDVPKLPYEQWRIHAVELAQFAIKNRALGQIWLNYILTSDQIVSDPFWLRWSGAIRAVLASGAAQSGIDPDVLSVGLLSTYFTWPIWAEAHYPPDTSREELGERLSNEILRLIATGVLRTDLDTSALFAPPKSQRKPAVKGKSSRGK